MIKLAHDVVHYWTPVDVAIAPLGDGHIHDTFLVSSSELSEPFVLQRFNDYVFKDPMLVTEQTQRILRHWAGEHSHRSGFVAPQILPTQEGEALVHEQGLFWRAWEYLEGETVDPPQSLHQIESAARAFGEFQQALQTLPGGPLAKTIPHFLELSHYLDGFQTVAGSAPSELRELIDQHSDHPALDLGDLVRSVSFSRGGFNLDDYLAVVSGFCSPQTGQSIDVPPRVSLTVDEVVAAPMYLSLMLGIRFLTDHLSGDAYFRVDHPGQNLARAFEQFNLLRQMDGARERMHEVASRSMN